MKRIAHKLKSNKSSATPHEMIFFDTETTTTESNELGATQRMILYTVVYYFKGYGRHKDKFVWSDGVKDVELAMFILNRVRDNVCVYIFSANLWFDLRVSNLLKLLIKADFKIKSCFANGKCFLMKMTRGKQSLRFINIQNIFPVPVKKIGEVIGLEKLDVDFDTVSREQLLVYCKRDTEIILNAILYWLKFIADHNLGCFSLTLASQAFTAYRHRFMNTPILIHDSFDVLSMEREGYFGGRTECFFIGEKKKSITYVLDINSQYPFVMHEFEYPYALRYKSISTTPEKVYLLSKQYCVMATCLIDTDQPIYPKRFTEKTVFPIGRFQTTLCTGSFRYAYEKGHIVKVLKVAVYRKGRIFKSWVKELYGLRQKYMKQKEKTMTYLVKLILNSLYGKFGQRTDKIIEESVTEEEAYYTESYYSEPDEQWYTVTHIGNYRRVVQGRAKEAFHSFPAISAHVTDYARMYLWQLIERAGIKNVYYVDTDSLYTNYKGYCKLKPLIDDYELGKLKLEKKAKYFKIYAPKDYIIDKKVKLKGVPKSAKQLDNNTYQCDMFPGMKRDLQTGMKDDYVIEKRIKRLSREYTKGIVKTSGRVSPFSLEEF